MKTSGPSFQGYFHIDTSLSKIANNTSITEIHKTLDKLKPTVELSAYQPWGSKAGDKLDWRKGRNEEDMYIRAHFSSEKDAEVFGKLKKIGAIFAYTNKFDRKEPEKEIDFITKVLKAWDCPDFNARS